MHPLVFLITSMSLAIAQAANLTELALNYPGPPMNTNSVTQLLEPYTAVFTGSMFVNNIQPTARCIGSYSGGTAFYTNTIYALEIGAIAPIQSKFSRAKYDKNAFYYKLVGLETTNATVKLAAIDALSSLDNAANKSRSGWGMYWSTSAAPNGSHGYVVEGKYIWPKRDGSIGGIPRPSCKSTFYRTGDFFDNTWVMNGTINANNAKVSWVRRTVEEGVLVQTLIFTFEGTWDTQTARLLSNGSRIQTMGQWAGFPKISAAAPNFLCSGFPGLLFMALISCLVV